MEPKVWTGSYIWILIRIHILLNNGLLYNRYLVHCYSLPLALTRGVNWEVRPSLTSPSQIYKIFANIGTFSALKDILGTPGIDNRAYFRYFHVIFGHWNEIETCGGLWPAPSWKKRHYQKVPRLLAWCLRHQTISMFWTVNIKGRLAGIGTMKF